MATATQAESAAPPPGSVEDAPFPITAEMFGQIVGRDLIPEDRRVYLLDGRLYEKMAKSIPHIGAGGALTMALARRLPPGWGLYPESTVVLDRLNAPLPDFAVIREAGPRSFWAEGRYPGPSDVGLLVEVGVTSLREDLDARMEKYARAMIPAYWVIDAVGRRIVGHERPRIVEGRGEYESVERVGPGQSIPLVLGGQEVARIPFEELFR